MKKVSFAVLITALCFAPLSTALAQNALFSVSTSTGNDTLFVGHPGSIIFTVEAHGIDVLGLHFPLEVTFTNGNIIGPLIEGSTFHFSIDIDSCFTVPTLDTIHAQRVTSPDTMVWGAVKFGDPACRWTDPVEVARITFTPSDTGTIYIDSIYWLGSMSIADPWAQEIPIDWESRPIAVIESCELLETGDVNEDGAMTSADIIYTIHCVFADCLGTCLFLGDVNCNGAVTSADIIYMVNYVFKGGQPPCEVCIDSPGWPCGP